MKKDDLFDRLIEIVVNDPSITDLHLRTGDYPIVRKKGTLERLTDFYKLHEEDMWGIFQAIVPDKEFKERFTNERDLDVSYHIGKSARFRVNIAKDFKGISFAIRKIPYNPPTINDLKLPSYFADLIKPTGTGKATGLILVVGPTGSGKTTLLASLIETINREQAKNIILLEDPIEYIFESKKSIIMQREIGRHTRSFATGIVAAKREDPDVVMIGEMRTQDAIEATLDISESGHLVFSTLHTASVIDAVDSVVSSFDSEKQAIIRLIFSRVIKAIISSKIVFTSKGVFSAPETLVVDDEIRKLIREWKLEELKKKLIDEIENLPSIKRTFYPREEHLILLYKSGHMTEEELIKNSRADILLSLAKVYGI